MLLRTFIRSRKHKVEIFLFSCVSACFLFSSYLYLLCIPSILSLFLSERFFHLPGNSMLFIHVVLQNLVSSFTYFFCSSWLFSHVLQNQCDTLMSLQPHNHVACKTWKLALHGFFVAAIGLFSCFVKSMNHVN